MLPMPDRIDARANARQYGYRLKAKDPFRKSSWKPEWFNRGRWASLVIVAATRIRM